jgi:hypothetical protein
MSHRRFQQNRLLDPQESRGARLTAGFADIIPQACFHTVLCGRHPGSKAFYEHSFFVWLQRDRFFVPGLRLCRRRAQRWSSMAAGHRRRRRGACLTKASTARRLGRSGARSCHTNHQYKDSGIVSQMMTHPFSQRRAILARSGQSRPYVRPVMRPWPLAIMGVRRRVRHQSALACSSHVTVCGIA